MLQKCIPGPAEEEKIERTVHNRIPLFLLWAAAPEPRAIRVKAGQGEGAKTARFRGVLSWVRVERTLVGLVQKQKVVLPTERGWLGHDRRLPSGRQARQPLQLVATIQVYQVNPPQNWPSQWIPTTPSRRTQVIWGGAKSGTIRQRAVRRAERPRATTSQYKATNDEHGPNAQRHAWYGLAFEWGMEREQEKMPPRFSQRQVFVVCG